MTVAWTKVKRVGVCNRVVWGQQEGAQGVREIWRKRKGALCWRWDPLVVTDQRPQNMKMMLLHWKHLNGCFTSHRLPHGAPVVMDVGGGQVGGLYGGGGLCRCVGYHAIALHCV